MYILEQHHGWHLWVLIYLTFGSIWDHHQFFFRSLWCLVFTFLYRVLCNVVCLFVFLVFAMALSVCFPLPSLMSIWYLLSQCHRPLRIVVNRILQKMSFLFLCASVFLVYCCFPWHIPAIHYQACDLYYVETAARSDRCVWIKAVWNASSIKK